MPLLEDYKACLNNIIILRKRISPAEFSIRYAKGKYNDAYNAYNAVQASMDGELARVYKEALAKLVTEKTNKLRVEREKLVAEFKALEQEKSTGIQNINNREYSDIVGKEMEVVQEINCFISENRDKFSSLDKRLDKGIQAEVLEEYVLSTSQLLKLKQLLEESFVGLQVKDYTTPIEKITNVLCFDINIFKDLTPFNKTVLYFVWTLLIFGSMIFVPLVFVVPYTLFYIYSIYSTARAYNRLLNTYYPFKGLEVLAKKAVTSINEKVETQRQKDLELLSKEMDSKLSKCQGDIIALSSALQNAERDVASSVNKEELTASAVKTLKAQMAAQKEAISRANSELVEATKQLERIKQELEQEYKKQQELRAKLTEAYLNPKEAGASKLLPSSFFLGFDSEGNLMEFNYGGLASMIEYRGTQLTLFGASAAIKDLILMVIMQLMMTVDITCITIHFVDTYSAGFDYAIFKKGDLDSVFDMVATNGEVTELIESMHNIMLQRSSQIMVVADGINEYNKLMISRKSFTLDYHVIIFQTVDESIFSNEKFLQVCKNGPMIGIVPLVFVPQLFIKEQEKAKPEQRGNFRKFLDSINTDIYCYDVDTSSLEAEDSTHMAELQKKFGEV